MTALDLVEDLRFRISVILQDQHFVMEVDEKDILHRALTETEDFAKKVIEYTEGK